MTQLNEKEMNLVKLICDECKTPAEITEKLKTLFAKTIEVMLEAELEEHLGSKRIIPQEITAEIREMGTVRKQ